MKSKAKTIDGYLAELPEERREAIKAIREVIRKNLDDDFEEGMDYGIITYSVPHRIYPAGYHCKPEQPLPFAALASQKQYMALYLCCAYQDPAFESWFREAWLKAKPKLNMGKSCVRFRKLEDVPLGVVGRAIRKVSVKNFISHYESYLATLGKKPSKKTAKTPARASKKKATKKTAKRSPASSPTKAKKTAKKVRRKS